MRPWIRWLYVIAGVAVAFVAVSSIVQAVRQGSWTPVVSVAWLPAVIVAVWPGTYRRCLRGLCRSVGAARPGEGEPAPGK